MECWCGCWSNTRYVYSYLMSLCFLLFHLGNRSLSQWELWDQLCFLSFNLMWHHPTLSGLLFWNLSSLEMGITYVNYIIHFFILNYLLGEDEKLNIYLVNIWIILMQFKQMYTTIIQLLLIGCDAKIKLRCI